MLRSARFAALVLPFLLLATPALATATSQPTEKPSPGQSKLPLSAYKMPNQAFDVPVIDVYTDAGDMSVTRMRTACEGRARLDAMPNGAQFDDLTKKLNLPTKAECAAFKRQAAKAGVKITREPVVRVPAAPQTPVFTDLATGRPQNQVMAPAAPPPAQTSTALPDDEMAPLNLNP
jgi:hypothetical protein